MDDELSAARRRGAVRKLLWPHGRRHKGFMHGKRWMGAALVLLVCALTAVGIAVFNGGGRAAQPQPEINCNVGVLALGDFFKAYEDHIDFQTAGTVRGLTRRLMHEPFEVSAQMTVESEALATFGIPLKRVPAQLEIKYDLRDAGVKVSTVGLSLFEACLSGNEAAAEIMGAEPVVADLPAGNDMSGDMTLENRIGALVPLAPGDLPDKLLDMLARSVPEECTQMQLGRAYSPKDKQDVNVTLIHTALDDKALSASASAFAELLKNDETLYAKAQRLTLQWASLCGAKDLTLESLLAQLIEKEYEGAAVSLNVYRRDEIPIGFALRVTTRDAQIDLIRLAEFDGETGYEHTQVLLNGIVVFSADTVTQDTSGEFCVNTVNAAGQAVNVNGTYELDKLAENAYQLTADAVTEGLLSENADAARFVIDARIDVGNGLGMIEGSPEWQDIKELIKTD